MKTKLQSADLFGTCRAIGLRKSSMSCANLIAFLICIFFSANTQAQDADVPVPTVTNTTANPVCGESVHLVAGGVSFAGYKCHWFRDADCTDEINTGISGTYRENLAITITDGLTVYCRLRKDDTKTVTTNFSFSGNEQVYFVPLGYKSFTFQVWGAQGGGRQDCGQGGTGGKGGYSVGTLNATSGILSIYVYVGGMGSCGPSSGGIAHGGWNGGGSSWRGANAAAGGGGGTDIRVNGNTLYNRIIVAGGGGGGGEDSGDGVGYGGGLQGGNEASGHNSANPEHGGTQTEAGKGGAFGLGANTRCDGGGGGGGWYGGGTNKGQLELPTSDDSSDAGGGAGGSGYVYTSSSASDYPGGCRLNSSLYLTSAQTIAGNTSFPATGGGNETGHSGNGYARITTTYYPTGAAGSITLHSYVDDPTSVTDASGCGSAMVSAVAPEGCVIDWYDAASGGNRLVQGSNTYTATASGTYYAESYKSAGCVSEHRVAAVATAWHFNGGTVSGSATRFQGTTGDVAITATTSASGKPDIAYKWYMDDSEITGATDENYTIPSATVAGLAVGEYVFTRKATNNCNSSTYEPASGSFKLIIVSPSGGTGETCGNGLVLYCTPTGTSSGTGSTTSPMDIVTALDTAANRASDDTIIIRMAAGKYTVDGTTLNLVDNLIIDGGWDVTSAGVWTKGIDTTKLTGTFGTSTSNSAYHRVAIKSDDKQNWKLQDLSIDVTGFKSSGGTSGTDYHSSSYKGSSVYGLYMTNTSDGDELIRVKIKVGNGGAAVQKGQDGRAATGNNGGSYRTAGAAKGSGAMLGKAGGSGGAAGTNGVSGGYGTSGKGGGQKGYDGNGANSTNGIGGSGGQAVSDTKKNPGGNGTNGVSGVTATAQKPGTNVSNSYSTYFIPGKGLDGDDGTGGGGGGGGGGSCGCGGTFYGITSYTGGTGGGGGGGGVGGHGGTGGAGGGGSFGIYCYNFTDMPIMQDVKITKGNAGSGASGQLGQQGGAGGAGGAGTRNSSASGNNCNNNDNHKGGNGGAGGAGGNGAQGGNGPNGEAYKVVVVPTSGSPTKTNDGYGDDLPSAVLTSIDYGISSKKGCTNSQIALTGSGGAWDGQYGALINDLPENTSSYSTDDDDIIVGYSSIGTYTPVIDGRRVFITQTRNIGDIDGADEFDSGTSETYSYGTELSSDDVMYWSVVSADGLTNYDSYVSVAGGSSATYTVNSDALGLTAGDYYIKLVIDNSCCGLSVPIWKKMTVNDPSALPIELLSFTTQCDGKSSLVEWTTASEHNNDHFELERSDDAVNFAEIARVAGAGNSIEQIDYTYTDYDIHSGDNYYRLWQVDYDGTRTASEIIVATCIDEAVDMPEVLAYPNPFSNELTMVLENFGNRSARIEIYDMLGRVVKSLRVDNPYNNREIILRLNDIPAQAYNIRISTADFVTNKQVVKN